MPQRQEPHLRLIQVQWMSGGSGGGGGGELGGGGGGELGVGGVLILAVCSASNVAGR